VFNQALHLMCFQTELSHEAESTIGDVERMRPFFQLDPISGKGNVAPNVRRISDGSTALQIAIKTRCAAAVKFLLENGADCSMVDYVSTTLLR